MVQSRAAAMWVSIFMASSTISVVRAATRCSTDVSLQYTGMRNTRPAVSATPETCDRPGDLAAVRAHTCSGQLIS